MGRSTAMSRPVALVIEDEFLQRMMAVDLVEQAGLEALEAATADEAIRILESRPDVRVVITDVDMPGGMDGIRLAAAIRDRWPPIEIIVVSGKRVVPPEELPARGVFFSKPYARDKLIETVLRMAE